MLTALPRALGPAFLSGWVLAVGAATALFAAVAGALEDRGYPPEWLAWVGLVLGLLLVAVGIRQWLRRTSGAELPSWMAPIGESTPAGALRLAVLLSAANPKILMLVAAGAWPSGRGPGDRGHGGHGARVHPGRVRDRRPAAAGSPASG